MQRDPLTIAVASSLRYVFKDLAEDFTKKSTTEIDLIFASSGKLTAQIENGAPFNIFVSADHSFTRYLKRNMHLSGEALVFAEGTLVLWSMQPLLGDLIQDLTSSPRIAIGNPKVAPYGRAALEVLRALNLENELRPRLVEGENIGQVNQFIMLEAAKVGFTAKSIVTAPNLPENGHWYMVSDTLHEPLHQSAIALGNRSDLAIQSFMSYLSSDSARKILEDYGYKMLK